MLGSHLLSVGQKTTRADQLQVNVYMITLNCKLIVSQSSYLVSMFVIFRHRVGASTKPKLVRPGRILVRLKSQMFEADIDAGEDTAMSKEEPDFRGRDFEKQYACR